MPGSVLGLMVPNILVGLVGQSVVSQWLTTAVRPVSPLDAFRLAAV
jgi:hypothetical protein